MKNFVFVPLGICLLCATPELQAGFATEGIEAAIRCAMRTFGREAVEIGEARMGRVAALLAAREGEEFAIGAVKRMGPELVTITEEFGEDGACKVVNLLARRGASAVRAIRKPGSMVLFLQYGEDATVALAKHPGLESIITHGGQPAIKAMQAINEQSARNLAIMAEEGTLAQIHNAPAILGTIEKYGDKAMKFVWEHKGALAVTATAIAFVRNPEPFLNGTQKMVESVTEHAVEPIAGGIGRGLEVAIYWAGPLIVAIAMIYLLWSVWPRWRKGLSEKRRST